LVGGLKPAAPQETYVVAQRDDETGEQLTDSVYVDEAKKDGALDV
jgi:hypothetical protein